MEKLNVRTQANRQALFLASDLQLSAIEVNKNSHI